MHHIVNYYFAEIYLVIESQQNILIITYIVYFNEPKIAIHFIEKTALTANRFQRMYPYVD